MKIAKYFLVGGVAATVDFLLFALLVKVLDLGWMGAAGFSFCAATLVNYLLSIRHVFRSGARFAKQHEMALVFAVSAIGLLINQSALGILIEWFGVDMLLAKIAATGSVFFWNYGARRHFIFKVPA